MFMKFFSISIVLFILNGCLGSMKIADAPSADKKGATMQTKVEKKSTKK